MSSTEVPHFCTAGEAAPLKLGGVIIIMNACLTKASLFFFSFLFFFFSLAIWRMYLYLLVQKILHDMTTVGPCFLRKPLFCKYIQTDSPLHITFDLLHILVVVCLTNDALVLCAFFFFLYQGRYRRDYFFEKIVCADMFCFIFASRLTS